MATTDVSNEVVGNIEDKILRVLGIFPRLSPSMLQIGLGTALPPKLWKPILEDLIAREQVLRTEEMHDTETGRRQVYVVLQLRT